LPRVCSRAEMTTPAQYSFAQRNVGERSTTSPG
jgi:hypothetical protein